MFELHPALASDCHDLGRLTISRLLLMNDSHYPWFILVPELEAVREIFELDAEQRQKLLDESCALAAHMSESWSAHKMNVAALGNMVPQLHVHHIARFTDDAAWPGPVWGVHAAEPYQEADRREVIQRMQPLLDRFRKA